MLNTLLLPASIGLAADPKALKVVDRVARAAKLRPRPDRTTAIAARQLTMYLLHKAGYTSTQIAQYFGMNNSTILEAIKRTKWHLETQDLTVCTLKVMYDAGA